MDKMFRSIGQILEAVIAWLTYGLLAVLPIDLASNAGGFIGRIIGPRLKVSDVARNNLQLIFPNMDGNAIEKIVTNMWENLGRTAAEHPHLSKLNPYIENSRVQVLGEEYFDQLGEIGKGHIFFSGHIGNWTIAPLSGTCKGYSVHLIYRQANNPLVNTLIRKVLKNTNAELHPKGPVGAKALIKALKAKEHTAMLVDQKMNDGIEIPFLGENAMTAPALAELSLKYDCPIIPVRVERLSGATFRITIHPPIKTRISGNKKNDIESIMKEVNQLLSDWILDRPEQWLWLHNRWPNK